MLLAVRRGAEHQTLLYRVAIATNHVCMIATELQGGTHYDGPSVTIQVEGGHDSDCARWTTTNSKEGGGEFCDLPRTA